MPREFEMTDEQSDMYNKVWDKLYPIFNKMTSVELAELLSQYTRYAGKTGWIHDKLLDFLVEIIDEWSDSKFKHFAQDILTSAQFECLKYFQK